MNFTTGKQLLDLCTEKNMTISQAMFLRETEYLEQDSVEITQKMEHAYNIMKQSIQRSLNEDLIGMGGMIGGESKKLNALRKSNKNICGPLVSKAITYAVGVLEVNASMGLIVAAPTAGSSGVIPGVLCAAQEEYNFEDALIIQALFTASAIGYLITRNATTAGAEGGCQAEVGSASAMAAAAMTQLMGGTPAQCLDAASFALINILGLVCDPVGGLVEVPCQNRNAMGASNALISAELALSGIPSVVPIDEAVEVMYRVGRSLPVSLRETAQGGTAIAPSACHACKTKWKLHS
ncbi:MAG: L-serine ammonia-lyase, iron-sulfur-dependent, subunit alpha [Clostridia bacterium]|nr:L-serine ammonia-lyase, iron-sulfur-dependent, subunit alpha [Lachnospiraceae bacterium]NCC00246.1 L-serine ammonia-lyase, iron-sulfur-dependent, subunit alpha [Clostridia bacterium]NCD02270.1 L-serine ammonia-lyase, iron-sulfur-dependent, subunit alpha [Clostridia bacterium]